MVHPTLSFSYYPADLYLIEMPISWRQNIGIELTIVLDIAKESDYHEEYIDSDHHTNLA
jgi:hypothetical protein